MCYSQLTVADCVNICDFIAAAGVMMDAVVVLIRLIGPFSIGVIGITFVGSTSRTTEIGDVSNTLSARIGGDMDAVAGAHLMTGDELKTDAITLVVWGGTASVVTFATIDSVFTSERAACSFTTGSSNRGLFSGGHSSVFCDLSNKVTISIYHNERICAAS